MKPPFVVKVTGTDTADVVQNFLLKRGYSVGGSGGYINLPATVAYLRVTKAGTICYGHDFSDLPGYQDNGSIVTVAQLSPPEVTIPFAVTVTTLEESKSVQAALYGKGLRWCCTDKPYYDCYIPSTLLVLNNAWAGPGHIYTGSKSKASNVYSPTVFEGEFDLIGFSAIKLPDRISCCSTSAEKIVPRLHSSGYKYNYANKYTTLDPRTFILDHSQKTWTFGPIESGDMPANTFLELTND